MGSGSGFEAYNNTSPCDDNDSDRDNQDEGNNDEDDGDEQELDVPCTQQYHSQSLSEDTPFVQRSKKQSSKTVERKIWSKAEKEALVSAFMNTSCDNIVGTQQKKGAFWERVHEVYDQARECNTKEISPRSRDSLKSQWTRISEAVQKWCGCYDKTDSRKRSGQNEDDVIREAHNIFESTGGRFHFYDEWLLMKKFPKYRSRLNNPAMKPQKGRPSKSTGMVDSTGSASSGKRSRDEGGGSTPDTSISGDMGDEFMARLEGVKKAKSRLKGKSGVHEAFDAFSSFGDRLKLFNDMRAKDEDSEHERLQFLKEKDARKKKQMEMDLYRVK